MHCVARKDSRILPAKHWSREKTVRFPQRGNPSSTLSLALPRLARKPCPLSGFKMLFLMTQCPSILMSIKLFDSIDYISYIYSLLGAFSKGQKQ
jgi:hypothetical protein